MECAIRESNQILRGRRSKSRRIECRLHQCWDEYEEGERRTVSQLLSECGENYGPSNNWNRKDCLKIL